MSIIKSGHHLLSWRVLGWFTGISSMVCSTGSVSPGFLYVHKLRSSLDMPRGALPAWGRIYCVKVNYRGCHHRIGSRWRINLSCLLLLICARSNKPAILQCQSAWPIYLNSILTVWQTFNDDTLLVPFIVLLLNKNFSANRELSQWPRMFVVVVNHCFVSFCIWLFSLLCSYDLFWYGISQLTIE